VRAVAEAQGITAAVHVPEDGQTLTF